MSVTHTACLPLVRTQEPSFMPKYNWRFDVPAEYLSNRYKDLGLEISDRFGDNDPNETLAVKQIKLPILKLSIKLPRDAQFSIFIPIHRKYAEELLKIFFECETVDDLIATALYVRDQVNPYMFAYTYSVTLAHRKDTQNIQQPALVELFPTKFLKRDVLHYVRENVYVVPENLRKAVEVPFDNTGTNIDPEHLMAYFREDIGINSHHWHWHLVYPIFGPNASFFDKDRRGELFYYMHQQMLCRYNTDRICNGLHVTQPLTDFRAPIPEGYFSKMVTTTSSRNIPPRQDNAIIQDIKRDFEFMVMTVNDLERHRDRILECIDQGYLIDFRGQRVELNDNRAIDILGNLIESSALSLNQRYYGSLHNDGHSFIAICHDPIGKYNEENAVMGDTTTAMRDPVFYRWHTMINDLFEMHKLSLPPYTDSQLALNDVKIDNVEFVCGGKLVDELRTFWQKTDVNLQNGLDFATQGTAFVTFTHLNYEKFSYKLTVTNTSAEPRKGTVRIWLCSINNEAQTPFFIEGTRKNSIEMDRFVVNLSPGINKIFRKSTESSVTIPFNRTFPPINISKAGVNLPSEVPTQVQQYCSCGWPDHMYLIKGTPEGFPCRLFVMISDHAQDVVQQDGTGVCSESVVYCGLRDRRYPDARPMGFPFDRPFDFSFNVLEDVIRGRNNMFNRNVTVRHINKVAKTLSIENLNVSENPTLPSAGNGQSNVQANSAPTAPVSNEPPALSASPT